MRALFRFYLGLLICFFIGPAIYAQTVDHTLHYHPEFERIDNAYQQGTITREEALIQKFEYAFTTGYANSADDIFHSPIKCLLPLVREYSAFKQEVSPAAAQTIETFLGRPQSNHSHTHLSDSGNFIFHYETEGANAVPLEDTNGSGVPDYVEHAAFAADSSYRYQVEQAGFVDFRKSDPYEIYFQNFTFYGDIRVSGSTTYIRVHNNFQGFPPNSHPDGDVIGALYVTIAHEIKHAIQYETNRWNCNNQMQAIESGCDDWIEMDATLMEEVVHPDVNDYYNYIKTGFDSSNPSSLSIFGNPGLATPVQYYHITWMLYFYEIYGIDFWVDVWEQFIENRNKPMFEAINNTLSKSGLSLGREHIRNHMWHMTSGPIYSTPDFGFSERENYPNANYTSFLSTVPDSTQGFLLSMSAQYLGATPSNVALGQPEFTVTSNVPGVGIGVVGYFRDGSSRNQFALNPVSNTQSIQTTWNWSDLIDISITVVNANLDENATYQLNIGSVLPDKDMIAQNYPNPFNPSTRIEFSLTETKNVKVEVYDSIGRKVRTLVDDRLERGFHYVNFDASGLASGIYVYRILTDQTSVSKKMVLIK